MKKLLLSLLLLSISSTKLASELKKVVTVYFASDGGRWTDPMVSAFAKEVSKSKSPVEFTNISVSGDLFRDTDRLVQRVTDQNPDLVFLPDDMAVIKLATKIREESKATIIYVAFYAPRNEIEIVDNQFGVFIEPDISGLLRKSRMNASIASVGVVSGPFGGKMLTRIENELAALGIRYVVKKTNSWGEYQNAVAELSASYDALWPLIPFGLHLPDGSEISDEAMDGLMKQVQKPTLGYGRTNSFKRTFSLDLDPVALGKQAGEVALSNLEIGNRCGLLSHRMP